MTVTSNKFHFFDQNPPIPDVLTEVTTGLENEPRQIPPKYFYDEQGSKLFEAITTLPEYYVTRAELEILELHAASIASRIAEPCHLIEYGSGSSFKVRWLLEAIQPLSYIPVDISKDHLLESASRIHADFPNLHVYPICTDYSTNFKLPKGIGEGLRTAFFPGSSIGNFERDDAACFIRHVGQLIGDHGHLILGIDKRKSPQMLHSAYNDSKGVTAAFNLNLLSHLNRSIDANFDVGGYRHVAEYQEKIGRIQMHLVSKVRQTVKINGQEFEFKVGERIHTENSYKYSEDEVLELAHRGGMECIDIYEDEQRLFMVALMQVVT